MRKTSLIIVGALPWPDPTPLRIARWSDLVRARPITAGTAEDPFRDHPALVAAYHALTHRVAHVILYDPRGGAVAGVLRLLSGDGVVLLCAPPSDPSVVAVLLALAHASNEPPITITERPEWPEVLTLAGLRPTRVTGAGTFTPPGSFKAYPLGGGALAAPLLVGAVSHLGPQACLTTVSSGALAPDDLGLFTDVRGVIRLSGTPPTRGRPTPSAPPQAAETPDSAIFLALERTLRAKIDALAFRDHGQSEVEAMVTRELRPLLTAALSRGLIAAFSLEVLRDGQKFIVDARVRPPRRVESVQLRLAPLEDPPATS